MRLILVFLLFAASATADPLPVVSQGTVMHNGITQEREVISLNGGDPFSFIENFQGIAPDGSWQYDRMYEAVLVFDLWDIGPGVTVADVDFFHWTMRLNLLSDLPDIGYVMWGPKYFQNSPEVDIFEAGRSMTWDDYWTIYTTIAFIGVGPTQLHRPHYTNQWGVQMFSNYPNPDFRYLVAHVRANPNGLMVDSDTLEASLTGFRYCGISFWDYEAAPGPPPPFPPDDELSGIDGTAIADSNVLGRYEIDMTGFPPATAMSGVFTYLDELIATPSGTLDEGQMTITLTMEELCSQPEYVKLSDGSGGTLNVLIPHQDVVGPVYIEMP